LEKLVSPALLVENEASLTPVEETLLLYYIFGVESKRKPKYITPIYYPFIFLPIVEDLSVLFDPNGVEEYEIKHKCVDVVRILNLIEEALNQAYTGNPLENLKKLKEEISIVADSPEISKTRLKGIVHDHAFLDDLKHLIEAAQPQQPNGLIMHAEIDEEILNNTREALAAIISHIEKDMSIIEEAKQKLNEFYDKLKQWVERDYALKYGQMKESVENMKRIIEEKISMLKVREEEELKIIEKEYTRLMTMLKNQRQILTDKIKMIRDRYAKSRRMDKGISSILRSLEDQVKRIDKRIRSLERDMESRIKETNKKYSKLITAEKDRLKHAEDEISRLNRIYASWDSMIYEGINDIQKILDKIMESLRKEKNDIDKLLILSPYPETLLVYQELFAVGRNGKPSIVYPSKIMRKLRRG
jgi:DNA repair exonuclease SbcCD ATPase subunit